MLVRIIPRSTLVRFGLAAAFVIIPLVLLSIFGRPLFEVLERNGARGVFLLGLVTNALFISIPLLVDAVVMQVAANNNASLIATVYAAGGACGELITYGAGLLGLKIIHAEKSRAYNYLKQVVRGEWVAKFVPWKPAAHLLEREWFFFLVLFGAMVPFPFTVVAVLAGATKYPVGYFFVATLLGRFVRYLVLFASGTWLLKFLCDIVSLFSASHFCS